jgi:myo-inositol-1(or 4)-monophosphatase
MDVKEMDRLVRQWTCQAGEKLKSFLAEGEIQYEHKKRANDLVTIMDREIEKEFVRFVQTHFPDHQVLGEEGIQSAPIDWDGFVWIIDPIDGTTNFIHQQHDFVISIALYHQQRGILGIVHDVTRNEMYHAIKGEGVHLNGQKITPKRKNSSLDEALIAFEFVTLFKEQYETMNQLLRLLPSVRGFRSFGATALALAKLAVGKLDAYLTLRTNPWDHAAGQILVKEAGGMISDFAGNPLTLQGQTSVLAANASVYPELLKLVMKK